jgi:hypothetical protein
MNLDGSQKTHSHSGIDRAHIHSETSNRLIKLSLPPEATYLASNSAHELDSSDARPDTPSAGINSDGRAPAQIRKDFYFLHQSRVLDYENLRLLQG